MSKKIYTFIVRLIMYTGIILLAILCILPFYIMIINGTRSSVEINFGISLLPGHSLMDNYARLTERVNMLRGFLNSSIVSISATILSSYVSAIAAFGFAFYKIPYRKVLYLVVLAAMMVPQQLGLIGYFEFLNRIGLLDTLTSLILPAGANAFSVFFLTQYLKGSLPEELIQAARIDGATEINIFHKIGLPIMIPGIATMAIFTFVSNWNNYLTPLVVLFDQDKFTVPMMIALLNSTTYSKEYGVVYLGIAMSVIPIMIIFALCSRYIIEGISEGSVKE